jgi:hypothetical protein
LNGGVTHKQLFRSLAALAVVALIGAGCSQGTAGTGNTGTSGNSTDRDQAVKFSECMRKNGVPDFPDPNASGDFEFGINVSPEVWTKAVNACKDLQPPGSLDGKRTPEQQAAALKFAQCVRDNGVRDFPDPANGDPLIDTTRIPSTDGKGGMSILNAAIKKCHDGLAAATGSKP